VSFIERKNTYCVLSYLCCETSGTAYQARDLKNYVDDILLIMLSLLSIFEEIGIHYINNTRETQKVYKK